MYNCINRFYRGIWYFLLIDGYKLMSDSTALPLLLKVGLPVFIDSPIKVPFRLVNLFHRFKPIMNGEKPIGIFDFCNLL